MLTTKMGTRPPGGRSARRGRSAPRRRVLRRPRSRSRLGMQRRIRDAAAEAPSPMAATRKKPVKRAPKPRLPARVKKRRTKTRSHHHPELWGLGMVAVGLFLATVLWLRWDGGAVGAQVADGLHRAFGAAAYVIPLVLIVVGGLMLVRSKIVDLKPFRTGLAVGAFGLMLALGRDEGGAVGGASRGRPRARDRRYRRTDRGRRTLHRRHSPVHGGLGRRRAPPLRHCNAESGKCRSAVARRPRPARAGRVRRRGR